MIGTTEWLCPEILSKSDIKYSKEIDIWSFGCFAHELLTSQPPHYEKHNGDEARKNLLVEAIINEDVPIDPNWSADIADFVKHCLQRVPEERWNITQLLAHEIFLGIDSCKEVWI